MRCYLLRQQTFLGMPKHCQCPRAPTTTTAAAAAMNTDTPTTSVVNTDAAQDYNSASDSLCERSEAAFEQNTKRVCSAFVLYIKDAL